MALRCTKGCHGNFVILHVKLMPKFHAKIKELFITYEIMKVTDELN